jgi:hypothetical protein
MENPYYELPEKAMSRIATANDIGQKIETIRSAASVARQNSIPKSSPAATHVEVA